MATKHLQRVRGALLVGGVILLLPTAGCARGLLFTTYTTIGAEVRGKSEVPTSVGFAYKRFEGAFIPVDPSTADAAHSVLASIDAEQSLWSVRVNQVFATGEAADIAAEKERAAARMKTSGPVSRAMRAMRSEVTP